MTIPVYYILSDRTPDVSFASGVLFFCDPDCRERYQPPPAITRLQSGDHPELSTPERCATCNEEILP